MTEKTAVELIHDLVRAEVNVMKQIDTPRGVSIKTAGAERAAAIRLFIELTGVSPTNDQVSEMVGM